MKNPKKYNEKIQWLKLYDRKEFYHQLVDKYEVRKYVASRIGVEYLVPVIGIWNEFKDIDFSKCPDSFVLKCTHDSGTVAICNSQESFDFYKNKKFFNKRLKRDFYMQNREWPYKGLRPMLIMEENISQKGNAPDDYKLMCFSGKVESVQYHEDRYGDHKLYFYDSEGSPLKINNVGYNHDKHPKLNLEVLKKMKELAEVLSKPFAHIRIDFYYTNNKIYFGEITFYDGAGFVPLTENGEEYFGNMIDFDYNMEEE